MMWTIPALNQGVVDEKPELKHITLSASQKSELTVLI
jgi:hypothetical protein